MRMLSRSVFTSALLLVAIALLSACSTAVSDSEAETNETGGGGKEGAMAAEIKVERMTKTDAEWKKILTPEVYNITVREGTERAFTSPLNKVKEPGTFFCVRCDLPLFDYKAKYESGTGWPSFYEPVAASNVLEKVDRRLFMKRTEILCARCDSHLGHVFKDGPKPTGLRYCMNGLALKFVPAKHVNEDKSGADSS